VKRISYWVLSTISAVVLLLGFDASQRGSSLTASSATLPTGTSDTTGSGSSGSGNGNGNASNNNKNSSGNGSGNGTTSKPTSKPTPQPTPQPTTKTVTGSAAQTMWGPVQVQLTVTGGKITKVGILQYPHGNGRDVEIANYSLPILIDETLKAQSAQIDMVSGATYTSTGYVQSLQSALDQANL
jgi:uncharacterized protein with FMN-binding domain